MRLEFLPQTLLRNLGWLAASIFLAVMIWAAANIQDNPLSQREVRGVPVDINLPDGYIQPDPVVVDAWIRTDQSQWELLEPQDVLVTADLTHIDSPGSYKVELNAHLASPLHGKIITIQPSTLTVNVAREVEKRVPVRVIISSEPPLGYSYPSDLSNVCSATEITVVGSEDRIALVDHVEVRMNLSDERNPIVNRSYSLIAVQANGSTVRNITLNPDSVTCSVDIQPRSDVFQMPVLPRVEGSPPAGYDFEGYSVVKPDTVGLTGNRRAISDLGGLVRTQPIDLTGKTETFTVDVQVELPEGVSLVPENQLISVTVTISSQISTRQYEDVPVEITGLDPTLFRATGLANTVTVFVSGPPDQLPAAENVRVVVDLTGLAPGNHQVEPQGMIVGQGETSAVSISVQPDTLSVTIESLNPTPTPSPTPTGSPTLPPDLTPTLTPTVTQTGEAGGP
jgi:YbbR domain-containing protein